MAAAVSGPVGRDDRAWVRAPAKPLPYATSLAVFVAIGMRRGTASGAPAGLRAVLDG
jgi:hypothetical protein